MFTPEVTMKQQTVNEAIVAALTEEMRRDARVMLFGEGVATVQPQLVQEFGRDGWNTPLSEAIIAGTAVGAAASGRGPLWHVMRRHLAMDAIVGAGKLRYMSGGQFEFPMVVLARTGAGWSIAQHP
jgi:pyruvate dehydrogenase E1 component beta subunit